MRQDYKKRGFWFILIAVVLYIISKVYVASRRCTGLAMLNPFCWSGFIASNIVAMILATISFTLVIIGILLFFVKTEEQMRQLKRAGLWILIAILMWVFPDPLPFVEEIIFSLIAIRSSIKVIA